MDYYYLTKKFTLIPQTYFAQEKAVETMTELFGIATNDVVKNLFVQSFNAHIVYSLSDEVVAISRLNKEENIYPFAFYLIKTLQTIKEYNKIVFHYSKSHNLAHVIISKGDELQLANAYNADSFGNAIYFLFLAIKQTIINPLQTNLQVYSELNSVELETIKKYFSGVKIHYIDSKINLL